MKELLEHWMYVFYTDLLTFLLATTGLIISVKKRKQKPKLQPLFFFFLAYIISELISFLIIAANVENPLRKHIRLYTDTIDTIIEFLAFFFLIRNYIVNAGIKRILNQLLPIFLCMLSAYFVYYKIHHKEIDQYFLQTAFTIQASILIVACVLCYIDLFKKEHRLNLTALPFFWIVSGLSLFMLSTLPFSVFGLYLMRTNYQLYVQLFNIFEVFYCVLFLMIIKAYLCKPLPEL